MDAGTIVVAKHDAPARFKNIKPGTLWVSLGQWNGYGSILVADKAFPRGIKSITQYFHALTATEQDAILNSGNTDLAVRLRAVFAFARSKGFSGAPKAAYGSVRVEVNGAAGHFNANTAKALAARNSGKLFQKKLGAATRR